MEFETSITGPVAVIGDVHGQVDKVERILDRLRSRDDYQRRWLIFIGDLVDRGPDPKKAIDLALAVVDEHPKTIILSGNHELAMAGALGLIDAQQGNDWSGRWLDHYGSQTTFESYGVPFGDLQQLREKVPGEHQALLRNAPWAVEHPEYFFVHSGLEVNTPFRIQRRILADRDFSLNRPAWLCSKRLPFEDPPQDCHRILVSGHAYVPQVVFSRRRILTDTTGGNAGSMSCVLLPENQIIFSDPSEANEPIWKPQSSMRDLNLRMRSIS